jgi:hypothetical protein
LHGMLRATMMGLGPRFSISPLRAPHCSLYILGCGLLFGLWSFLFFFSCYLVGVIYLFIYSELDP